MSVCTCLCARFCGSRTHLFTCIHMATHSSVWKVCWILPGCACISMTICADHQTCMLLCTSVCLCVRVCVCGPPCLSVHPCRIPVCMQLCMYASSCVCPSFCSHLFVVLYVCVALHAPLVHVSEPL